MNRAVKECRVFPIRADNLLDFSLSDFCAFLSLNRYKADSLSAAIDRREMLPIFLRFFKAFCFELCDVTAAYDFYTF